MLKLKNSFILQIKEVFLKKNIKPKSFKEISKKYWEKNAKNQFANVKT